MEVFHIKQITRTFLTFFCTATLFTLSGISYALAGTSVGTAAPFGPILVAGRAVKENEGRLHVTNSTPNAANPEIILNMSQKVTRILDVTTSLPVSFDDITDGENIYAYIGPAVTLSLPPQGNALVVLCKIPTDYKVPEYLEVSSLEQNGLDSTLTATNGQKYTISTNTLLLPYLTRNIVTVNDLTVGRTCLLWLGSGSSHTSKIVIFPEDNAAAATGWKLENGSWYYYKERGSLHYGWLLNNGEWYYLEAETGKMLTKKKTFTPDSNGVLY